MRIAAIDLGSNSFHLVVVDAEPDGSFVPLAREKEMLRLGDVVSRERLITAEAAARAVDTIRRFRTIADSAGADEIVACATAAFRQAENGGELVDRIYAETGVRIRLLSGLEEARLVFEAVRASVVIAPGPALCLDLGGGSLEVTVGSRTGILRAASVELGVARLTAELVRKDPPSNGDVERLRERITEVMVPLVDDMARFGPTMAVGTSGTITDLARMAAARRNGAVPASANQLTVQRQDLLAVHDEILSRSASRRARMPGLDARRADQIPAGSMVLVTAMELFGLDRLTISDWALREGMVLDLMSRIDPEEWSDDVHDVRRRSVLHLARRCNWDEAHGRQVARLATRLFDLTAPLHGFADDDREFLEYAALLHDIGRLVSVESHHKHTAYLIRHGRLRGFDHADVDALAALARYHRRAEPKPSHEPFASLDGDRQHRVTTLAALLRVAEGLDLGHHGAVDDLDASVADDSVTLRVSGTDDVELEVWGARRKRGLFEKVFDRRLEVVVAARRSPRPVVGGRSDGAPA
jgi:exopolyphosphatase / guanosine-5'-triphosphate,3'-diphosphate pyrophosphatase